jgi:hypothetical protein
MNYSLIYLLIAAGSNITQMEQLEIKCDNYLAGVPLPLSGASRGI